MKWFKRGASSSVTTRLHDGASKTDRPKLTRSILAVATISAKGQNEDSCGVFEGEYARAIAVADGVGSSRDSHIASRLAVTTFLQHVKEADSSGTLNFVRITEIWRDVSAVIRQYRHDHAEMYRENRNLETTLLTLLERPDSYLISYVGNGSIWQVRGDFWEFGTRRWPWCMTDLVIGHTLLDKDGHEALYADASSIGLDGQPRMLAIPKDLTAGELFIVTTDGLSSQDHNKVGTDSAGKLWVEVPPHIHALITTTLPRSIGSCPSVSLQASLDTFLKDAHLDDDASIGVLVSPSAVEHWDSAHKTQV